MGLGVRTGIRRLYDRASGRDAKLIDRYFREASTRKLQIGCGENVLEGWLNCDLNPKKDSVLRLDATKRFPFDDGQFDYVFSEHFIEHIDYPEGLKMLSECRRVLKPGGKARITTPNMAFLIDLYRKDKSEQQLRYIEWATKSFINYAPATRDVFVINNFFTCDWGHRFIYDQESLTELMQKAGFGNIRSFVLGGSDDPELRGLENESRMPAGFLKLESITVEGERP
jgi:predicted SAM-dependent methyltransferase